MPRPAWKIPQPPVEDMRFPVQCMHCLSIYDIGHVLVTARFSDCSVWTAPCCGHPSIDDRPWLRDRHYREVSREDVVSGGDRYDVFGLRHRGPRAVRRPRR